MNTQMLMLIISFVATTILGFIIVPKLKKLKIEQVERLDGPKSHLSKGGTPVMGGIIMIIVVTVLLAIKAITYHILLLPIIAILGFGIIGFIDDYKKLVKKDTKGLSPILKMTGLFIISTIFIIFYLKVFNLGTDIIVPFLDQPIALSIGAFGVFTYFILLGTSNAVNLTDGLDGLASGVTAIIMTFFTAVSLKNGNVEMAIVGVATVGTCLGFLLFNYKPAKVFMGDTGSLALGGAIASIAIILKMPLYLAIVAIVCVVDTLSSALQVVYFKLTKGKRIFKMAPFHHHLELCGIKEITVVWIFWSVTVIACLIAYFI